MLPKTFELVPQAPQATTDLHRISLGLESGISDQCIYSLCCLDSCIIEGLINPVRDEGLWNRCEASLLRLLHSSASGPLLLHTLNCLSLSMQLSDPESDSLVPRLIDVLMGEDIFSGRERKLALRCLTVIELDEVEIKSLQRALILVVRFSDSDGSVDLVTGAIALMSRYINDFSAPEINSQVVPHVLRRLQIATSGSSRKLAMLRLACIGIIHLVLETKPDIVSECRTWIVAVLVNALNGGCGCGAGSACEFCQGCVSCLLRIGVHPVMREDLMPFMDVILQVAWNWKSGSPIAAQSLLNMMSGLLH